MKILSTGILDVTLHNRIWHKMRPHLPTIGLGVLVLQFCLWMILVAWELPSNSGGRVLGHVLGLGSMAVGPGLAIGFYVYYKDQFYDESFRLLGRIFLFSGLSGSVAGFFELGVTYLITAASGWDLGAYFIYYFAVVGLSEELVKFGVVYVVVYKSRMFKQVYDGILFCGASALGFATIENIMYVFTSGNAAVHVAITRAILSVPGHIAYGLIMGYCMGRAREVKGEPKEKEWLVLGLGGAVILHGAFDFVLLFQGGIVLGALIDVVGWYAAYRAIKESMKCSPFVRCNACSNVIPQVAKFCLHCREEHQVELHCNACHKPVDRWMRRCSHCSTRIRFPWHLQIQRLRDLYPRLTFYACPSCKEAITKEMTFCLHCGNRLNLPQRVIDDAEDV